MADCGRMIARIDPENGEDEAKQVLSEISARLENIKNIAARSYDTEWGNRSSISRNPRLRPYRWDSAQSR